MKPINAQNEFDEAVNRSAKSKRGYPLQKAAYLKALEEIHTFAGDNAMIELSKATKSAIRRSKRAIKIGEVKEQARIICHRRGVKIPKDSYLYK